MRKKKSLNQNDIKKILEVIKRQQYLAHFQHEDKDILEWMNNIACRNIRDGVFKALEEIMDEDEIPYEDSYELNDNGIKNYRKENNFDEIPD
jgi:hypothetical protein